MNQKEEGLYKLSEWVSLVNRVLSDAKRVKGGEQEFNKTPSTEEVKSIRTHLYIKLEEKGIFK